MTDKQDNPKKPKPANAEPSRPILIDVRARTGPEHEHEQLGSCAYIVAGAGALVLDPGLNVIEAARWSAFEGHPSIKAACDDGRIKPVILDAMARAQIKDLAKRSSNADALALILEIESARPRSAGKRDRYDAELVAMLESKVERATRNRTSGLSSIKVPAAKAS